MEVTYSADAVDLDAPAYEAQTERPDRPIRLRVQPTLLRVKPGETVGNHQAWPGVSWTLECQGAEEAIAIREALRVFFATIADRGSAEVRNLLTAALAER